MIKFLHAMALAGATGVAGYLGGNIFPAPAGIMQVIDKGAGGLRASLDSADFSGLRALMSDAKFAELKTDLNTMAVAAGEVIEVDQDMGTVEEQLDNLAMDSKDVMPAAPAPAAPAPAPAPAPTPAPSGAPAPAPTPAPAPVPAAVPPPLAGFEKVLLLCPRMTIQNSPAADAKLNVTKYSPTVKIKGVAIATFPVHGACLSSGYGTRNARLHKGLDYHNENGAPILAAGDGTVLEMKYRDDYGNMLLIDHGGGVYTRYAHLASFGKGLSAGVTVKAGEQIGLMGNTAGYQIPMHLHYEVLVGDYANPKASFGLEPVDPLTFPAAN